jgi:Mg/Co/Ni transporter MgtE
VVLMLLQSASSFILDYFQELLKQNVVITLFLTMLVGAGGNAGNQCAVHVIRGLATKQISGSREVVWKLLVSELLAGGLTAAVMCFIAFFRVRGMSFLLEAPTSLMETGMNVEIAHTDAIAIAGSLFIIVLSSTVIGTLLPLGMFCVGLDPAHAGPSIQVVMDVMGVAITCLVCRTMLVNQN